MGECDRVLAARLLQRGRAAAAMSEASSGLLSGGNRRRRRSSAIAKEDASSGVLGATAEAEAGQVRGSGSVVTAKLTH